MNFSLHLSDFQSALIWNTAMVAGILIAFTLQWHEGKRRGFDMPSWITVLAVTYVAMLLGERLGAFTISDWQALGRGEGLPAHVGKTAIGGGLLALPIYPESSFSRWAVWGCVIFSDKIVLDVF